MNNMFLALKKLSVHIQTKTIPPVFLIIGEEPYLINLTIEEIKNSFRKKYKINPGLEQFNESNVSMDKVIQALNSPSLFQPFRMIIVKHANFLNELSENEVALLNEWIEENVKRNAKAILVCTASKIDKRKKIFKSINNKGYLIEFAEVKSYEKGVPGKDPYYYFALQTLKQTNMNIDREAWVLLRQRIPNNLNSIMNAIDVLIAFKNGMGRISIDDVNEIIPFGDDIPVYVITETISKKSFSELKYVINYVLQTGTHPILLNRILSSRIRLLILAKQLIKKLPNAQKLLGGNLQYWDYLHTLHPQIVSIFQSDEFFSASFSKLHTFVLFNLIKQANFFKESALRLCLTKLSEIDVALKSTDKSPELLFELALLPFFYQ